jgi:hypothetical protein
MYSMVRLCVDNVMFGASVRDLMLRNMIFVVLFLMIMPLLNTIELLYITKRTPCPWALHI